MAKLYHGNRSASRTRGCADRGRPASTGWREDYSRLSGKKTVTLSAMTCSRCHKSERIPGQRWCRACLTAYQRERRAQGRGTGHAEPQTALTDVLRNNVSAPAIPPAPVPAVVNTNGHIHDAIAVPVIPSPSCINNELSIEYQKHLASIINGV
jgi:hypothetical protein